MGLYLYVAVESGVILEGRGKSKAAPAEMRAHAKLRTTIAVADAERTGHLLGNGKVQN